MKALRYIIGIPVIIILGLVACVLILPYALYGLGTQIFTRVVRTVCWIVGKHTYDIYSALLDEHIENLRCTVCGQLIPKENLLEITRQRDDLKNQITFVAQHLQETQENTKISNELGKLE